MKDVRFALPPVSEEEATSLVAELAVGRLLAGARGRPRADTASLARAIAALSRLAVELGDLVSEVDVNPVIVSAKGCVAVDALVKTGAAPGRGEDPVRR